LNQIANGALQSAWVRRELDKALKTDALSLVYQPRIDLKTGELAGVEALIRWSHPERGSISPDEFIPRAEESKIIDDLTLWVADRAFRQAAAWIGQGFSGTTAINVSASNLKRVAFPDALTDICWRHNLSPKDVVVEITETASQKIVKLLDTLTRLRIKGFKLALDDFGIGFSSLAQLQQLPFSELKVDRAFVSRMGEAEDCRIISRAIINLAHDLGLKVVAEGVETAEALRMLVEFGCDAAQGYYISRPLEADTILPLLRGGWSEIKERLLNPGRGDKQ
jgi:EAL domain-containing protein (putative c-di-GMP-specific phosphodiesterase class I)